MCTYIEWGDGGLNYLEDPYLHTVSYAKSTIECQGRRTYQIRRITKNN